VLQVINEDGGFSHVFLREGRERGGEQSEVRKEESDKH